MSEIRAGAKAGLLAGVVYASVEVAVVVTLLIAFKSRILEVITPELPPGTSVGADYNLIVATDAVIAVLFGITAGLLLGLVIGEISAHIPGKRYVEKGLVLGLVLWFVLHVFADYIANLRYGVNFYLVDISLGLATSLVFGAMLGIFFEREVKRAPPTDGSTRASGNGLG